MYPTAMLRFSDAEQPTIPAHREIVDRQHATWWGWWKKKEEPFPGRVLTNLKAAARLEPLRIGLVNRKGEERLYVAICGDVAFSEDGLPIPSPDPSLTPEYYRGSSFPAWFNFTRIDDATRPDFLREFGIVPSLDPTLYEVFLENQKIEIRPKANWSMEAISIPGDTILHLSDVHFGEDHGFPLERRPGEGVDRLPLWEIISSRILRGLGLRVGVVVVSGDLITRGDANVYPAVEIFLVKLLESLGLDRQHCVIVPGNHDLWTSGVAHPTRDYAHEAPYKQFVSGFFKMEFQGLERVRRYRTRGGDDLIFIELNSSRIRSDELKEYGYVSRHRYADLLEFVVNVLREDPPPSGRKILFSVLHHHVLPVWAVSIPDERRPLSLCLDAGELIDEFRKHGIRFVLHGHQHFPFIGTTSRAPTGIDVEWRREADSVFVLGCGSSGAKAERLPRDLERGVFGNICGIYTLNGRDLKVSFEQYSDLAGPTTLWRTVLPAIA
jgi:predicted MPP superfamily phosphohydrolase